MTAAPTQFGPVKAVIFDMDGLLLNTEGIYTEVTQMIADRYGREFHWGFKQNTIGLGAGDLSKYIVEALELPITPEEFMAARAPLMYERFPLADAMPGAEALVRHLKAQGIPVAVGTSSSQHYFDLKITRHREWFELFDTIVTADDPEVGAAKPAPDIFLVAASRLGVNPADCLVFEDSPFGITAAKAAGMFALAIPDPAMAAERYTHADGLLTSLNAFEPGAWGLPPR